MKKKTKDVRLRIDAHLHARLKVEAAAQERSMNWLVGKAIEQMLQSKVEARLR